MERRPCFINIIVLPLSSHIPMNANVMLQDAMFIHELFAHIIHVWYYRKPTVTWDPMENKTNCNLGLLTFSSNCIASKLQNYCIHINDEYVYITYFHTECNLQLHVIVRLVITSISLSITYTHLSKSTNPNLSNCSCNCSYY